MAAHPHESPDHSSPESFEIEDDSPQQISSTQWQIQGQTSPSAASSSPSQQPRVVAPLQKRRRVTRACDECRRKKIKCDGKQPCTHCTVYSYDCTYDQPSNRRRNPAPQYIEALETRLQRAEALLRTFIPNFDVKDPNLDSLIQQRQASKGEAGTKEDQRRASDDGLRDTTQDAQLRSMIESTGQLDLDERGDWDFHGGSSGAVFLRKMRQEFGGLLGSDPKTPFLPRPPRPPHTFSFDSPRSMDSSYGSGLPNTMDLPAKDIARSLCHLALVRGCSLLRFVHGPTFYEMFDKIYDRPAENFGAAENRFLPLLYVVLALGSMFAEDPQPDQEPEQAIYNASIDQGLKYYRAGRSMMDITDCRDIISLQAVVFMILFLQSSSNLSTCYTYVGIALRSALRMGLHRNLSGHFNPIERETRRRVFWVIRKMDTYVSALLGFPRMLDEQDIDQELPLEIDDEYITKDAILPMPADKISTFAASNAHTRLMAILAKVIKYIYPIKGVEQSIQPNSSPSYVISHAKIKEIEGDLQDWLDKLPMALRPGGDGSDEILRVQQLLRIAYAHVQMMLYRPFLHYASDKCSARNKCVDDRSYACAAACVSVSRNVVHITSEMRKRGVLMGAYWFTIYTTFFAILSLAFYVLENPDKPGSQDILADASVGKDALQGLAKRSLAADRCNSALNVLFEKLPEKLKRSQAEATTSKKRRSAAFANPVVTPDIRNTASATSKLSPVGNIQRASTLPAPIKITSSTRQSASFDGLRIPTSASSDQTFRQSFHESIPQMDVPNISTPGSAGSGNSVQDQLSFQAPYGNSNGIPDLSAMMFPSADPFAYPNQPMMDFDNRQAKPEAAGEVLETSEVPNMFAAGGPNVLGPMPYGSLEGQLFGPIPPYLMQNPPAIDLSQLAEGNGSADLDWLQDMRGPTGLTPGVGPGTNFEEIFGEGNDDWNQMYLQ